MNHNLLYGILAIIYLRCFDFEPKNVIPFVTAKDPEIIPSIPPMKKPPIPKKLRLEKNQINIPHFLM